MPVAKTARQGTVLCLANEPVETEEYFLTELRYIHKNPIKAGICSDVDKYKYCSYNDYVDKRSFIGTEFIDKMIDFLILR